MTARQILYLTVRHGRPTLAAPWGYVYPQLTSTNEIEWSSALAADGWTLVAAETLRREQHVDRSLIYSIAAERQLIFQRRSSPERDAQLAAARGQHEEYLHRSQLLKEAEASRARAEREHAEAATRLALDTARGAGFSTDGASDESALATRRQYVESLRAAAGGPLPDDLLQTLAVDSYWFWRARGSRGDIQVVADELNLPIGEATRLINRAGSAGLLEQRRPPGL